MRSFLLWRLLGVCIVVSLLSASVQRAQAIKSTQTKPDFSGSWILDAKKSDITGPTSRWDLPMKISHQDPVFRIAYKGESKGQVVEIESLYFTDGRGEANPATSLLTTNTQEARPGDIAKQETKSKTCWSGNKIVIASPMTMTVSNAVLEFELVDEWELSADGKTLTQTMKTVFQRSSSGVFFPAQGSDKKRVYRRV